MTTPWGQSQHQKKYADGIVMYSTASHGGFHLSEKRIAEMPEPYRNVGWPWYEEDCDWCKVVLSFPQYFSVEDREAAKRTAIRWYPHEYMKVTGEIVTPMESLKLRQEIHERNGGNPWEVD